GEEERVGLQGQARVCVALQRVSSPYGGLECRAHGVGFDLLSNRPKFVGQIGGPYVVAQALLDQEQVPPSVDPGVEHRAHLVRVATPSSGQRIGRLQALEATSAKQSK